MADIKDFSGRKLEVQAVADQIAVEAREQYSMLLVRPPKMPTSKSFVDTAKRLATALEREQGLTSRARRLTAEQILASFGCGIDDEWWVTPLGDAVAGALPQQSEYRWTYNTAASFLGVTKGTVGSLVHKNRIFGAGLDPNNTHAPTLYPCTVVAYKMNRGG